MRLIDADALDEVLEKIPCADIKNIDGQAYALVRLSQVFNVIKNAPTIEPERKTGIWKNRSLNILYPEWERYECSVCGGYSYIHKFCPNCGAKMEEGEQE